MVRPRVLIVDDDPGVCFALRRLLESVGEMRAVIAESADAAESELARGAVDALVLDFHLRGMRGDAFFHRACEMQPSLVDRTLFISGDMSAVANDAMTETGCPMLIKPFLASALLEQLRALTAHAMQRTARSA
jgi:DNA-binding NtrC family response regulator